MAANADIWTERDGWRGPLGASVALHGALFGVIVLYAVIAGGWRGSEWGGSGSGGGDAMSATLVSNIPLPANPEGTNVVATESKGLTKSKPKAPDTAPDAIPIPAREAKRKPWEKAPRSTTQKKPETVDIETNVAQFGEGGPLAGPYSVFSAGGAKGGFGFTGGGGDFGSKYSWYVDVVRRKVSENWLKYEIDPRVSTSRRVYITFDIARSGKPDNVQVEQTSGVPSLDISAVRAIQRIDSFGPLPGDYSGGKVSVEFWFDYRR
jgi:periplasmic protein TonB